MAIAMDNTMNTESSDLRELQGLVRFDRYQLPHRAKRMGWVIFIIAFIALFFTDRGTSFKMIAKYAMLLGLLLASLSKEKVEDELVRDMRMRSYSLSFVFAVLLAIAQPILYYITKGVLADQTVSVDGMGGWMILWVLLSVQVLYFEILKKAHS